MSSDVRLNCREAKNLISKTRKYLKGDQYKTLTKVDKKNDQALRDQERIYEASKEAKQKADAFKINEFDRQI